MNKKAGDFRKVLRELYFPPPRYTVSCRHKTTKSRRPEKLYVTIKDNGQLVGYHDLGVVLEVIETMFVGGHFDRIFVNGHFDMTLPKLE